MLTPAQLEALTKSLEPVFATKTQLEQAVVEIMAKSAKRLEGKRSIDFSISKWIRGNMAARGVSPITGTDPVADREYFENTNKESFNAQQVKDLSTTATPGSYLVPTIQANEIISYLSDYGTLRRAGIRIIPMVGIEKLNMPTALGSPTVAWVGQNTAQAASDSNLGQVQFSLKTARSLTPVPNELLATSVPAIDTIITELLAQGFGEAEDQAFFSTATVSNGPASIYNYSVTSGNGTVVSPGGGANGAAATYADLLNLMKAVRIAKAVGPFVWFANPYTLYSVISGMIDKNSRPIFDPNQVVQRLFGWPIFDTSWIKQDQTLGSVSNCSYLIFTNPKYLMLAEPGTLEIAVSTEFYFDKNQIAIRGVKRADFGYAPPLGIGVLKGIA